MAVFTRLAWITTEKLLSSYVSSLCLALLLGLNFALAEPAPTNPIKIGVLLALTGPYPLQGNAFKEGLALAEAEINEHGGIGGVPIKLVIEDTANEAKHALSAAKKTGNTGQSCSGAHVLVSRIPYRRYGAPTRTYPSDRPVGFLT